jgi:uncharacterized PurR-regulated membrane protein YhhQ (DUF165 family)
MAHALPPEGNWLMNRPTVKASPHDALKTVHRLLRCKKTQELIVKGFSIKCTLSVLTARQQEKNIVGSARRDVFMAVARIIVVSLTAFIVQF